MNRHPARWTLLVLACLLATACQDRRDPVKPTTGRTAAMQAPLQAQTQAQAPA